MDEYSYLSIYGFVAGLGLVMFLGFLVSYTDVIELSQEGKNMFAIIGGVGLVMFVYCMIKAYDEVRKSNKDELPELDSKYMTFDEWQQSRQNNQRVGTK